MMRPLIRQSVVQVLRPPVWYLLVSALRLYPVLIAFFVHCAMWKSHFRLLEMKYPSHLIFSFCSWTGTFRICWYSLYWSGVLKCRHSAFVGAKVYPRLPAVVSKYSRVLWAASCPDVVFLYEVTRSMSSTYLRMRLVVVGKLVVAIAAMSLMLTRKSIGESGEPCGVPLSVAKACEFFPLKRDHVARFVPQCPTHCTR